MHKPLSVTERAELQLADKVALPMTRRDKLMRLAEVARAGRPSLLKTILSKLGYGSSYDNTLYIFDGVEHRTASELANYFHPLSVFDAALKDPVLYDAGLRPDQGDSVSVARAMQFFELTQTQMHPLSCNCGGLISNADMGNRIERMAG